VGGPPAGVFVTLRAGGELRGCIGHITPTRASLLEEVAAVAPLAAVEDPRFPPVRADELDGLDVEVSVLEPPEPCAADQLDPRVWGVIVTAGGRRGLLLPDLEGVDSVEQQLAIARRKAGVPPGAAVALERFRVRKEAPP
ncbi:MAG TPA: AmmeMemoRadiSam system protein A, partial [Myxococcota bacterium]|nr:AmmeMemoRadiSam system protein A [Myxococcota bacterium]